MKIVLDKPSSIQRQRLVFVFTVFSSVVIIGVVAIVLKNFMFKDFGNDNSLVQESPVESQVDVEPSQVDDTTPDGTSQTVTDEPTDSRAESESQTATQPDDTAGKYTPETAPAPFTVRFGQDEVVIVNKKHPLPKNYNPGEDAEAVQKLHLLISDAQKSGVDVTNSYSGYRSYSTQVQLFNNYVQSSGREAAETYSARPGYSEHQTGLTFDLKDSSGNLYRSDDDTYDYNTDWIAKHAPEYGFIVRYRNEWQSITGYIGESWHLRYLGVELATQVYRSGKTIEEFFGVTGGGY